MRRFGLTIRNLFQTGLMVSLLALGAVPALAQQGDVSVTTSETTTSTSWISDWRIWALVGAVVLILLILALTRGRGGSNTTVVK